MNATVFPVRYETFERGDTLLNVEVPMSWPERVAMLRNANENLSGVIHTLDEALAAEVRENERLRGLLQQRSWRLRMIAAMRRVFG